MADQNERDRMEKRRGAMKRERSSFDTHYMDLARFTQPRRGRFFTQDRNFGGKKHNNIINSAGTRALRVATAGVLAGIMSPARPWFALGTPDPGLMEFAPVKLWLFQVENILRAIFNASNLYNMAPTMLGETILFGTGVMSHVDDFQDVSRFYAHTVGSYTIAQDERQEVSTLVRQFEQTTFQMVDEFGLDNVSQSVKNSWDRGNYEAWFPVVQFVQPNVNAKSGSPLARFKRWSSDKYEPGNTDKDKFLSRSGFDQFPGYALRWETTGEDVYGTNCPGMIALGDIKQLQLEERRKAQAIDKMVNPPLTGPSALRNTPVSGLPGGVTIFGGDGTRKLEPIYTVNAPLNELGLDIQAVTRRIDDAFYVDMFLAISSMEGIQPKNQLELSQRDAERLLQLGPVLEQFHGEFLDKVIDRTFNQALNADLLPPPPQELEGQPLKVTYISSLAMAQRAVATTGIERLTGYIGGLVQTGYEQVLDKFDADQAVDEYSQLIGTPPKLVVSDDDVEKIRQQRAEAEQVEQNALRAQQAADVAQTLSTSDTEGNNALTQLAGAATERAS